MGWTWPAAPAGAGAASFLASAFDPQSNSVRAFIPLPGNTNFSATTIGITLGNAPGTLNAAAGTPSDTSYVTRRGRLSSITAAGANSSAGLVGIAGFGLPWLIRRAGFAYVQSCGHQVTSATYRWFMGLHTTNIAGLATDPSGLLNIIGIGADSADTNVQVLCNDAAGVASKVDLGANFPARTADACYMLSLGAAAGSGDLTYQVKRLDVPQSVTGSLSANVPALGTALLNVVMASNGAAGGAVTLAMMDAWTAIPF